METIRVAEQLEKRSEKFTKFNANASTSKPGPFYDKGLLPTPEAKASNTESGKEAKGIKIGQPDPYLSKVKCYRCNEWGHKSNTCPQRREIRLVEGKGKEVIEQDGSDFGDDYDDETLPE